MKITGTLPNSASRQEEIAVLEMLSAAIGDQTYLSQLFSKEMLSWAKTQIQNDFCPDLYGYLNHAEEEKAREHDLLVEQERYRMIDKQGYEHTIKKQIAEIEFVKGQLTMERDTLQVYIKTNNDLAMRVDAQAETVSKLEQQVKELKEKLYDLMTKEA